MRCHDKSIYTGITDNVEERVKEHNEGKGANYTSERRPVSLVYQEEFPDKFAARRREEQIKNWGRKKKEKLISPSEARDKNGFHKQNGGH